MFDDWCLYVYLHRWIQIKWHGWLNANTTFRLLRLCHCINDGALLLSAQWHTFILATAAASYHNHSKCIFTNNYACLHKWAKKKRGLVKKKHGEKKTKSTFNMRSSSVTSKTIQKRSYLNLSRVFIQIFAHLLLFQAAKS